MWPCASDDSTKINCYPCWFSPSECRLYSYIYFVALPCSSSANRTTCYGICQETPRSRIALLDRPPGAPPNADRIRPHFPWVDQPMDPDFDGHFHGGEHFISQFGCFQKNGGIYTPKMNGEKNGTPYYSMDPFGGKTPLFSVQHPICGGRWKLVVLQDLSQELFYYQGSPGHHPGNNPQQKNRRNPNHHQGTCYLSILFNS